MGDKNPPDRIGLISDIHGNSIALQQVIDELDSLGVTNVVCAGDVVGYGPSPNRCIKILQNHSVPTVEGNHDRAVAAGWGYEPGDNFAVETLPDCNQEWITTLPRERTVAEGQIKLVHDHPEETDRYTYPSNFDPGLLGSEDILVLGHTHVQHSESYDDGIVVNPGSVGQPRDGVSSAAFAVAELSGSSVSVSLHRVEYNIDRVAERMKQADLPESSARRLRKGK